MNLPYKLKYKKNRKENRLQVLASFLESYYVLLFFSDFVFNQHQPAPYLISKIKCSLLESCRFLFMLLLMHMAYKENKWSG